MVTTLGWATELVIVGRLTCDTWVTICDSTIELVIVGWLTCDSWATIYGWASELVIVGRFTSSRVTKGVRVGWLLTNFLFGVCLSTSDGADRMRVSWATCTVRGRDSLANPLYDLVGDRHEYIYGEPCIYIHACLYIYIYSIYIYVCMYHQYVLQITISPAPSCL